MLDFFAMVFKQYIGFYPNELIWTRLCTNPSLAWKKKCKVREEDKSWAAEVLKINSDSTSSSDPDFVPKMKKEKLFSLGSPNDNIYVKMPKSKEFYICPLMGLNKKATVVDSWELGL